MLQTPSTITHEDLPNIANVEYFVASVRMHSGRTLLAVSPLKVRADQAAYVAGVQNAADRAADEMLNATDKTMAAHFRDLSIKYQTRATQIKSMSAGKFLAYKGAL